VDSKTFIFADLCSDAIEAAVALKLREHQKRVLELYLAERVNLCHAHINVPETLCVLDQLWAGVDIYNVQWNPQESGMGAII
jgi:hypothetical protein